LPDRRRARAKPDALVGGQLDRRRRARRRDRQLAAAAVDEHRERDARRPAEVVQLVDGGADRPAGVEHVVDEDDVAAVDVERQLGVRGAAREPALREVVAVQRDREHARRTGRPRSFCSRSASQAPPVVMPTRTPPGLSRRRTPASSSA
jgi:hypothetical protein